MKTNITKTEDGRFDALREEIKKSASVRSAWGRGVLGYALTLVDNLEADEITLEEFQFKNAIRFYLLIGASDWHQFSWGGCSLIYDEDIARMLCTPSELKRTHNGERKPNGREEWLDIQARALSQAARLVEDCAVRVGERLLAEARTD